LSETDDNPDRAQAGDPRLVVGLHGTVANQDQLFALIREIPRGRGVATVVLPDPDVRRTDFTSANLPLPVVEVNSGLALRTENLYLMPDAGMEIRGNGFKKVEHLPPSTRRQLQDRFFRSLARNFGDRLVALQLSEETETSLSGLRAVGARGGMVIAVGSAVADSVVEPSIATELVDRCIAIEELGALLLQLTESTVRSGNGEWPTSPGTTLAEVESILSDTEDFNIRQYKPQTVDRRIRRRMSLAATGDFDKYVGRLRAEKSERTALINDLMINVTRFFRDPAAFQFLSDEVIPALLDMPGEDELRIWVPGCATGEEAYSIAMLLLDKQPRRGRARPFRLFATDIDEDALEVARAGRFPADIADSVPAEYLNRYFSRDRKLGRLIVKDEVRSSVSFAVHDIASDPPFSRLHLISCRNVLIYLTRFAQQAVLDTFVSVLEDEGFLFLGGSESPGEYQKYLLTMSRKSRIFRKIPETGRSPRAATGDETRPGTEDGERTPQSAHGGSKDADSIRDALLDAFVAPGVVVDADGNVRFSHGDWKQWLSISTGEPSRNICDLVVPSLRGRLRSAIYKARKRGRSVSLSSSLLDGDSQGAVRSVRVELTPVGELSGDQHRLVAITFREMLVGEPAADCTGQEDSATVTERLESELLQTRQELQDTVEELESSSEELHVLHEEALSANEELQSANEELEARSEELRCLNEELSTLNEQLATKVRELQKERVDVENFFASTNVPTVFLRPDLEIARFTPAAGRILKLGKNSLGRHIGEISGTLLNAGLIEECKKVLSDFEPVRREIELDDGRSFLREVVAYRTEDRRVDGIVLVFQDVTRLKELSHRADMRNRQQSVVADLGLMSLSGAEPMKIMQHAVSQIAAVLDVEYCKILEHRPESSDLIMVAGTGWADGAVGSATVPDDRKSQAGFTLATRKPVVVRRLDREKRFQGPQLLIDYEVVSGMSCLIEREHKAWGVLGIHTRQFREFTQDDVNFMLSVANLVSIALRNEESRARLHESQKRFVTMANSIPQLAWITDEHGHIYWYNQRWYDYTGTTLEEVEGWGWKAVHHPDHVDRVVSKIRQCFEEGVDWEDTFPLRGKDGRYRWFLSRAEVIRDARGKAVSWFGTNTDITEQLEQEETLRASREKIRIALQTNEIGTFEFNLNREETHWDGLLKDVWGLDADEVPTQTTFWECIHPQDRDRVAAALERATNRDGDGRYYATYRVINRKTGKLSWLEASGQTIKDQGKPDRMVGLVINITERKELEESLQEAVSELTAADRRKNEFLAVLGHELRNPLAVMNSSVETLELKPDVAPKLLPMMSNSVRKMNRLLDDLLDLQRVTQDKIALDRKALNVRDILTQVLDAHADGAEARHQELTSDLADELWVDGDETRLEQVFTNLVSNAIKYTSDGGRIAVSADSNDGSVRVRIRDSGIGIEERFFQKVFDPFFQVGAGQNSVSGLGIGLALAKRLTSLHGGSIQIYSDGIGKGTSFVVTLPAVDKPGTADCTKGPEQEERLDLDLELVLIDDNDDLLATLADLLRAAGCGVRTARTGEHGLALARSAETDAVLVDIGLPDMSGYEVAKSLRRNGFAGQLIAISGFGHEQARRKSESAGFDHHIAKPASIENLLSVLRDRESAE